MQTRVELLNTVRICRIGKGCKNGQCVYQRMEEAAQADRGDMDKMCLDYLLEAVEAFLAQPRENRTASVVPREALLAGVGYGWEETWLMGDEEDPERFDLEPCVWIDGHVMLASGSTGEADGHYWREQYGREYGLRVWAGQEPPTEEQRRETPWTNLGRPPAADVPSEAADPLDGRYTGLISEE